MRTLFKVFKPNYVKLALFALFTFICIGGVIQSYAFIDDVPGIEKPPLYDQLSILELWFPWILLSTPVHLLGYLLGLWWIIKFFPEISPGFSIPLASIAYSYVLSSWAIHSWRKYVKTLARLKRIVIIISLIITLILHPLPLILILTPNITLDYIIHSTSGFIFIFIIVLTYIIALVGLITILKKYYGRLSLRRELVYVFTCLGISVDSLGLLSMSTS